MNGSLIDVLWSSLLLVWLLVLFLLFVVVNGKKIRFFKRIFRVRVIRMSIKICLLILELIYIVEMRYYL